MIRQLSVPGFYHNMGTGHLLRMKPPVISCGKLKGKFIILEIIFPYINIIAILCDIVEGLGFSLHFLAFFSIIMLLDIAAFCQLLLDLGQIAFSQRNIQGIGDRLQMIDLTSCLFKLFLKSLLRTFQFAVFVKIFLGIFGRSHGRIQRNGNFFIIIIVHSLK